MCPKALIIPCPCSGILLGTAVTCPCDYKGTFSGQFLQPRIGCPRHIVAINIMYLAVACLSLFLIKHHISGQFPVKAGGLIHIVPNTGNTVFHQISVVFPPPPANFLPAKIGIYRRAGPDHILIDLTLRRFRKISLFRTLVIDRIPGILLDAGIDDRHKAHPHLMQILSQPFHIRELFLIHRKHPVSPHIVDIQMNRVTGNIILFHVLRNAPDILLAAIPPAGLMISQSPELRQRRRTCQVSISLHHILHGITADKIIIQIPFIRREEIVVV